MTGRYRKTLKTLVVCNLLASKKLKALKTSMVCNPVKDERRNVGLSQLGPHQQVRTLRTYFTYLFTTSGTTDENLRLYRIQVRTVVDIKSNREVAKLTISTTQY